MMFRRETEFQETEIGEFPKEWEVKKLGDVLLFKNGKRPNIINEEGGIPVYGANGIMGYTNDYLVNYDTTIIFGRVGAAGKVHLARGKIWVSDNAIYAINRNKSKAYLNFIFYLLSYLNPGKFASKTTHPIITQKSLENLKVPLPPLEEQKKIADILSIIDSGIEAVDRAIAKLEGMKRVLLNELLTGRIRVREENGKLTFYKETDFQDTEIGRIPKDWYVKRLKEVANFQRGFSYKSDEKFTEEVSDGYLFLSLNSVKEGGGLKEDGWSWIKSDRLEERHFVKEGDIVITNTEQSKDGSLLGSPAIVHFPEWYKKGKAVFSMDLSKLLLRMSNVDVNFLFYYLSFVQPLARKYHTGTNVWHLNLDSWARDLLIPLPLLEEQKRIADVLLTVDKAIELYRKEKERLLRLKRGLMSVLLTGRVRVIGDVKNVGVVT